MHLKQAEIFQIIEIFCRHDLTLISVALPESAFSDASFMIVSGLRERLKRFPDKDLPLILTFANAESNGDKLLAMMLTLCLDEPLESKLNKSCPNCVIDRICTAIVVDEKGVSITAERYALMVLETIYCCNALSSVAEKWEIEFKRPILKSVSSLHVWQKLKYWGLNGLHLFLASAANTPLYPGFPSNYPIRIADVISNPRIRSLVDGFAAEVSLAIRSQAPGQIERNEAKDILINSLHRVSQADDTNSRILSSLSLDNSSIVQILQKYGFPVDSPYSLEDIAHDIRMDTIGYFLQKVEVRILDCAFVLAGDDEVHPINLLMGSLCILKALAVRARQ